MCRCLYYTLDGLLIDVHLLWEYFQNTLNLVISFPVGTKVIKIPQRPHQLGSFGFFILLHLILCDGQLTVEILFLYKCDKNKRSSSFMACILFFLATKQWLFRERCAKFTFHCPQSRISLNELLRVFWALRCGIGFSLNKVVLNGFSSSIFNLNVYAFKFYPLIGSI